MGQVYRATDTTLSRQVAIKILPDAFAADADRLARFEREAKTLASLNHPHIAAIYGFEKSAGMHALVMEFVEGEDLSQLIARQPSPEAESLRSRPRDSEVPAARAGGAPRGLEIDDALRIARQIAEALETAHEQGIIHRDLKPANIKVRDDGTVKVLDFGLAKAMDAGAGGDFSQSPTITTPAMTQAGVILGTAAYMSPEQARGKTVDRRADIWAFGVVLFEMLTGQRAFKGDDITITLASVLMTEPDWAALPSATPAGLRRVITRCLKKDVKARMRDIGEARQQIEELLSGSPDPMVHGAMSATVSAVPRVPAPRPEWSSALPWTVAAALAAALTLVGARWAPWRMPAPADQPLMEFEISAPEGTSFGPVVQSTSAVVSPDGRQVVLIAGAKDGPRMLWLRPLASNAPRVLPGTEGATRPFWSPDGRWVGFSAAGKLKRIGLDGGQPQAIADTNLGNGTSNAGGVTLFADAGKPVYRVSSAGGTPAPVFELDGSLGEIAQNSPQFLPDGNHFLYVSNARETGTVFASLDSRTRRFLVAESGSPAIYAPNPAGGTGWLLNYRTNQLLARPFDPIKGEVTGEPVPIADSLNAGPTWSVSNNGVLMFRHFRPSQTQLTWFSRDGKQVGVVGEAGTLGRPRLSPDQKTVAFSRTIGGNSDVWLVNLARSATTRFTFEPGADSNPVWSPDSQRLIYSSRRQNEFLVAERPASGIGAERIVTKGTLNSSGRNEVFVRTLPKEAGGSAAAGKWQVSFSGGGQPTWRADGKEIFYLSPEGALMAVPVESAESSFRAGTPHELFRTREAASFDVTAGGQRFLVNQSVSDSSDTPVTVILNWPQLLKK